MGLSFKKKSNQLPLATSASLVRLGYCSGSREVKTLYSAMPSVTPEFCQYLVWFGATIVADRFDNLFSREQTTLHRFLTFENTAAVIPTHPPPPQLAIFSFLRFCSYVTGCEHSPSTTRGLSVRTVQAPASSCQGEVEGGHRHLVKRGEGRRRATTGQRGTSSRPLPSPRALLS